MRTRSTRRTKRVAAAALISVALITAACGGSDDGDGDDADTESTDAGDDTESTDASDDTATDETTADTIEVIEDVVEEDADPIPGGTLVYGIEADVDGLNPTTSALSSPGLMMANTVFDSLTRYDQDGVAQPYLAETVEPVDGDFSKWQVKVREGVMFHDGTPVNADALIKNFESQLAAPLVGLAVKPFYPETGATEKIDEYTVQYNLLEPNAYFPGALASQLGFIASPAWLDAAAADPTLNQAPVGSGPFVFDSRSADSVTRVVRNEDWWNGSAYLDAIEFKPVTDPDTRVDLLFQGEIQGLQTDDAAAVIALTEDDSIQNIIDEGGEEGFLMLNSSIPPFDDIRARQALAYQTELDLYRDLISLSSSGGERPADSLFIEESKYHNPDVVQVSDDPEQAAALAGEYCAEVPTSCTDGKINMTYTYAGPSVIGTRAAEFLKESWSPTFNVELIEVPQDDLIQTVALGQYNVVGWRQFGATDPALDNVWLLCRTIGGISLNWPKYCDPARDELLLQAQAETDEATRIALYQELAQKLSDDFLYIFTTHTKWDNAFTEDVRGVCDIESPEGVPLACVTGGRNWFDTTWFAQ
jgi:peptide/nickel transport system substrate-binding protein